MEQVEEHRNRILDTVPILATTRLDLAQSRGYRLATDIHSRHPVPAWDNSGMDGYALRHADLAGLEEGARVTLRIVADLPAGSQADPRIGAGEAVRIMTGAAVPSDADTVVQLEHTNRTDPLADIATDVDILIKPKPGANIRRAGEDIQAGTLIARHGDRLHSTLISAIATAGCGEVEVYAAPKVAVIATGSELVHPNHELLRGQIPDSNSYLHASLARDCGAEVVDVRHVDDEPDSLSHALEELADSVDVFVLIGGVSQGAYDPVTRAFNDDTDVRFTKVAMQPGKPQAFGRFKDTVLFGLPGNPVSAWVSFHVFVRPALLLMQGVDRGLVVPTVMQGIAAKDWSSPLGRRQYIPAVITWGTSGWVVEPAARLGSASHLTASLARANGYAIIGEDRDHVSAGEVVDFVYDFEGTR